jgi:hypothetical protein
MDSLEKITAWSVAIGSLIGVIGKFVYDYIKAKSEKNKVDLEIEQNDQYFIRGEYQKLVTDLKISILEMKEELRKVHLEHISCREENAQLKARVSLLEEKMGIN